MNPSKRKFVVSVSIAILLIGSFLYFGNTYLIKNIEDLSAKIVNDKKTLHTLSMKNEQSSESKKKYEEIKNEADNVLGVVINKDETVNFITETEKIAADNNVKLKMQIATITDKEKEKAGKSAIGYIYFDVTAGGKFEDIMRFLESTENLKYYAEVETPKMSFGDFDEYNKEMVILTFDAKVYKKGK